MPKHNFATLTCVGKTLPIITTSSHIRADYTALISGQIGLSFGGEWSWISPDFFFINVRCTPTEKSPVL
ncbi:unnamed protein product [Staurois parvus]|uniref:Uncharacterized protein n=1 Tax=Staurois parvus TaxID=386267 RepID=A0ABN9E0U3_9NEOB|nr:unnamed protein product [Staurois parvus]